MSESTTAAVQTDGETTTGRELSTGTHESETRILELEAENERLREAVAIAHRRRYRRSAIAMAVLGIVALLGAGAVSNVRTVLIALGGTGLFAAVLTYYLTPERFVAATVGERVYGATADNEAAIVDDLDIQGSPHVVPAKGSAAPARLFVPLDSSTPVPESIDVDAPFRVDRQKGVVFKPTGVPLYELLVDATNSLPSSLDTLAVVVADALVEQFELVDAVDVDTEPGRATLAVNGSTFGPLDQFDHPVVSLFATTIAVEQETPVKVAVTRAETQSNWLVTCRWNVEDDEAIAREDDESDATTQEDEAIPREGDENEATAQEREDAEAEATTREEDS